MSKTIYPYLDFTATDIYNRCSSGIADTITNNGTSVDYGNIKMSNITSVINEGSYALSNLYTSEKVNIFSHFGPGYLAVYNNQITRNQNAPFKMGDFAGYNHNAVFPYISDYPETVNSESNTTATLPLELEIGEIDYSDISVYKFKGSVKHDTYGTLGTETVTIAGNTTNNSTSRFIPMQIDWNVPGAWLTNKTIYVEIECLTNTDTFLCYYPTSAVTINWVRLIPPYVAVEVLGASEGGWDLADATWNTSTSYCNVGTTPSYTVQEIEFTIDGTPYTGTAALYISKPNETPVFLNNYSFSAPVTISGNAPWDVDYGEYIVIEIKQVS